MLLDGPVFRRFIFKAEINEVKPSNIITRVATQNLSALWLAIGPRKRRFLILYRMYILK